MEVSCDLSHMYDNQYSNDTEEWRRLGAIKKAANVIDVVQGEYPEKVIDIGAGDGNILKILSEKGFGKKLYALEISESAIRQIKKKDIKNLEAIVEFDGYTIPFADQEFDLAICSHVIEHAEYPRRLLKEIQRISHYQVFEIPVDFSFRVDKKYEHFSAYGHINIFTPALFRFLLLSSKFEILKDKYEMYGWDMLKFQYAKRKFKFIVMLIKTFILKSLPFLMHHKPHTYTVYTRKMYNLSPLS